MIRETPPQPTPAPQRPRWTETLRDPAIASILVYALLAIAATIAAYFWIFTVFAPYDDEGTLLVTVQSFANGDVLYRDIYSPYGPFYYEVFGGLFALTGKTVTTDASRSIVIVLWVATSLLYGISVQRLSGRLALGAAGMIAAFGVLFVLANEPMHPQGLCVLLLGALTLLVVCGPGRNPARLGAAAGAVAAALVLTKLNLGVYAVAAAVLAAVLTFEPLRSRPWIRWPVVGAVVAMPILIAARDLDLEWVRNLVAVETLGIASVAVAGLGLRPRGLTEGFRGWLVGGLIGFAVASAAILAAILATGASPSAVYGGMVTEAVRVRDVNMSEFPMPGAMVDWAIAGFALAVICWRLKPAEPRPSLWWSGVLRILAGLVIWFTITSITPFSLSPTARNPISIPIILAWVAVLAPGGVAESPFKSFMRLFLPALAVAEAFQVYPVAGSQMRIAALTFVPVGALCIADGVAVLRAWNAERGRESRARFGLVVLVAGVALAVDLGVNAIARPAASAISTYRNQPSVGLPGATHLHLPEDQVQAYRAMVDSLHRYGCTDFVGYPNINSFYLWSGIEPPPPNAPGVWLEALDSERQQRIVNELRASERPCVIRSENRAALWLGGREVPQRPLVRYIFGEFRPVETVGEFEFMLPKPGATG